MHMAVTLNRRGRVGLGKEGQGMNKALAVQQVGKAKGVILDKSTNKQPDTIVLLKVNRPPPSPRCCSISAIQCEQCSEGFEM